MPENIFYQNKSFLEQKIRSLQNSKGDFYLVSDFDSTLTKTFVNGKPRGALATILYREGYLSPYYQKTAQALYDKYYVIERNNSLPLQERKDAMEERFTAHRKLLVAEGLTKEHICDAMQHENLQLREEYVQFFRLLQTYNIPLVIFSAGSTGIFAIEQCLKNRECLFDNIAFVGNDFLWNEEGKAIGVVYPLIHPLNKDETMFKQFPIYEKVKDRKQVILLGDSLGDVNMVNTHHFDVMLKVGFLNQNEEKRLDIYLEYYDVVVTQDGTLEYVNKILSEILC